MQSGQVPMKFDVTGVILAGGKNSRLPGEKKTFRKIGDKTILDNIYTVFSSLFKEVIIVVNDPEAFAGWDMTIVTDIIPSRCALAGLHAGLFYASYPYVYATACDTPFLRQSVVEHIVGKIEKGYDVIVPRTDDGLETLSAAYSKECIPLIEENLKKDIYMIKNFFRPGRVKEIPITELRPLDPELQFIFNVNTPEDLERARMMAGKHPEYHKAGMILCHNGVVRATSREGDEVTGLEITVDHDRLSRIISEQKKRPGIVEILIHINEGKSLKVGDDVMFLVVAGNIRENVIAVLTDTLNLVKSQVTSKKQFFTQEKK